LSVRLALAGALLAGVALPPAAHADPPSTYCTVTWVPFAQTSPNLPPVMFYRPAFAC
jgi:hypothetical protein